VKYVRVTPRSFDVPDAEAAAATLEALLDAGDALDGGEAEATGELDAGVLAVVGAFRVGGVVRNIREPEVGGVRLPRQVRAGAAFDADLAGLPPFVVALDADLRIYDAGTGDRRVVALGVEHWLRERRIGVRGGARFNTAGAHDGAVTGGASVAVRAGLYVDGYVMRGSGSGDDGWGLAARVSF
jgi:hypothetical protein